MTGVEEIATMYKDRRTKILHDLCGHSERTFFLTTLTSQVHLNVRLCLSSMSSTTGIVSPFCFVLFCSLIRILYFIFQRGRLSGDQKGLSVQ